MDQQWCICKYDSQWKDLFQVLGVKLRESLGENALRIDHVGSTSIVDLDAKPIIDIQISVPDLKNEQSYMSQIVYVGFQIRRDNPDRTKRFFRERPGERRTHIHVREAGSYAEQVTLLFRDYLRAHPEDCRKYTAEKHRLMGLYKHERSKYVEGKEPIVWEILQKAHEWSQATGWKPGPSDIF